MTKHQLLIIILLVIFTCIITSSAQKDCYTPVYKQGECISVEDCEPLSKILNNPRRNRAENLFLRDSACGFANNTLQVCCETNKRKFDCTTPDEKKGICIPVYDCPSLYDKILDFNNLVQSDRIFFKDSRCHRTDNFKYCCSDGEYLMKDTRSNLVAPRTECGRENQKLNVRNITDGELNLYQYPWMVSIEYTGNTKTQKNVCNGILISSRYLLSAAHCYRKGDNAPISIILEALDFADENDVKHPKKIKIEKIIPHPDFDPVLRINDIALIRMSESLAYSDSVRPICLPQMDVNDSTNSVSEAVLSGWNLKYNTNISSQSNDNKKKLQLKIPIVEHEECNRRYRPRNHTVSPKNICAGGVGGKSSCAGDSGAPLMRAKNDQLELLGILNYGNSNCKNYHLPDVFINVFLYTDWIIENLEP